MAIEEQSLLACGRPIDQVWEHIEDAPDAHEAGCPDCQQARRSLAELDEATSSLRLHDESDPDLAPPPGIKVSIMDLAKAEVRRGSRLPLRPPTHDDLPAELTISEQTVAGVVRFAADRISGLHARRCKVSVDRASLTDPKILEDSATVRVVIDLGVALSVELQILEATRVLRESVRAAVLADTGMSVETINVSIEDLFDV